MPKISKLVVTLLFFMTIGVSAVLGQSTARSIEGSDKDSRDIITELRRTRNVIEQLQSDMTRLQVAAIRIRVQMDLVASKEARLDAVNSQRQVLDEVLAETRDRLKRLEATDTSGFDEGQQQRTRAEVEDAQKEIERTQVKLDAIRLQDSQLTAEVQSERARLGELIAALEALGSARVAQTGENDSKVGDPAGPPKR